MDFMRALSILFVVINIYWFCYGQMREWGINIGVVDRILLNFDRTAGLFPNVPPVFCLSRTKITASWMTLSTTRTNHSSRKHA